MSLSYRSECFRRRYLLPYAVGAFSAALGSSFVVLAVSYLCSQFGVAGMNELTDPIVLHGFRGAFEEEPEMMWGAVAAHRTAWTLLMLVSFLWQTHTELLRQSPSHAKTD